MNRVRVIGALLMLLAGLLLVAGCATPPPPEDYTFGESNICKVHGICMTKTIVPIEYGYPNEKDFARYAASTNTFPNGQDWIGGGCCPRSARQAVIYICLECKRLSAQWEAEHAGQFPRAETLLNPYVYVDGEVQAPNRFLWTKGLTLADAIQEAGGFTIHAKVSKVTIRHETAVVEKVNCSRKPPNGWESILLAPGDVVRVPRRAGYNPPLRAPHPVISSPRSLWGSSCFCRLVIADSGRSPL